MQKELFDRFVPPADVVYTPEQVCVDIINFLNPSGLCLDPCRGDGAFYKHLPIGSDYCEITEGKDFFEYAKPVDWIIGNPPYSNFMEFLQHSFSLASNVSFLVPTNKIFQRQVIMNMINRYGGIRSMIIYGSGQLIGFPFGFSVGNFHFQKGYTGECKIEMGMKQIFV
jgi:hypothetical protein